MNQINQISVTFLSKIPTPEFSYNTIEVKERTLEEALRIAGIVWDSLYNAGYKMLNPRP